jgi:ABC-2 type transport system ATP-binding protein
VALGTGPRESHAYPTHGTCRPSSPTKGPAMTAPAIEVAQLGKVYGSHQVVDDVSFEVARGSVTGFLGPNGAGKSTTLRMLVGLTRPTSGSARVLGGAYQDLPNPGRRVGVLVDASAQHMGRTGGEVLWLDATVMGIPLSRVDVMLDRVGLSRAEAKRRCGTYSLGMRQRLGIAHALMGDPEVLILDEPANGLDPAGIRWMRGLLRDFADAGGAVLLSSHLLAEIEAVADALVVIGNGRIVANGSKQELLDEGGVYARTADIPALQAAVDGAGLEWRPAAGAVAALKVAGTAEQVARAAARAGLVLLELRPAGGGLEELFLTLTEQSAREGVIS